MSSHLDPSIAVVLPAGHRGEPSKRDAPAVRPMLGFKRTQPERGPRPPTRIATTTWFSISLKGMHVSEPTRPSGSCSMVAHRSLPPIPTDGFRVTSQPPSSVVRRVNLYVEQDVLCVDVAQLQLRRDALHDADVLRRGAASRSVGPSEHRQLPDAACGHSDGRPRLRCHRPCATQFDLPVLPARSLKNEP